MTAPELRRARVAVFGYFFVLGVATATWSARLPAIKAALHLSDGRLGLALFAFPVGSVLTLALSGRIADRFGTVRVLRIAGVLVPVAIVPIAVARDLPALMAALAVYGAMAGLLDVAMNACAARLELGYDRPIMSSLHAGYSIAGLAGAGIGGVSAWLGIGLLPAFAAAAAALVVLGLLAGPRVTIPAVASSPPRPEDQPRRSVRQISAVIWILGLLALCGQVGEGSAGDWSAVYLHVNLGSSSGVAAAGLAAFSVTMAAGRLAGDRLASRFGSVALVRASGLLAGLGLAAGLLAGGPVAAIAGFALLGAGLAGIFPQIVTSAARLDPEHAGRNIGRIAAVAYSGLLTGPVAIGAIASGVGLRDALLVPAALAVLVAVAAGLMRSRLSRPRACLIVVAVFSAYISRMGPEVFTDVADVADVLRTVVTAARAGTSRRRSPAAGKAEPEPAAEEFAVPGASTAVPAEVGPASMRGREEIVADLVRKAGTPGFSDPQILVGAGGMGKSAIAQVAAAQVRDVDQRRVWWISASQEQPLSDGLVTMARSLGASRTEQEAIRSRPVAGLGGIIDRVWQLLEREPSRWLLVFDQADDPALLGPPDGTGWARRAAHGLVLITTRNADEKSWPRANFIPVSVLCPAAAADVLIELAPEAGSRKEACALAERLGFLPLALFIAGMALREDFPNWPTFADYRRAVEDKGAASVIGASKTADRPPVTRTWELSLDALVSNGVPQARPLMRQLSCYAPDSRVPLDIVTARGSAKLPGPGPDASAQQWTEYCLEGLRGLRSVGLIQRSDAADGVPAIELHPLIAEITRAAMDADVASAGTSPLAIRERAATALTASMTRLDPGHAQHWPFFRLLTPHVQYLLADSAPHLEMRQRGKLLNAMVRCIAFYMWSRAEPRAEQLALTALELARHLGADGEPVYLRLRHAYAWSLRDQGRLEEAEELFRKILTAQLNLPHGPTRADALRTRHDLAWTIGRRGNWQDAEAQFRDVLTCRRELRRRRGLSGDDADILHTRCMLSWCIGRQGRWAEAEREYRLVAKDRAELLGPDHADTLDTTENIGKALAWQERWADAGSIWEQTAAARAKTLGEQHPDTLRTRQLAVYAAGYQARGAGSRVARRRAAGELERILDIQAAACGNDHKETLETRTLLAVLRDKEPAESSWPEDLPRPAAGLRQSRVFSGRTPRVRS